MSQEEEKIARFTGPAFNEFRVQAVTISGEVVPGSDIQAAGQTFTTQLSGENGRVGLFVYNNSDPTSGELFFGHDGVLPSTGFPVPKGALMEIPVHTGEDVYFATPSGELGDLRIFEIA